MPRDLLLPATMPSPQRKTAASVGQSEPCLPEAALVRHSVTAVRNKCNAALRWEVVPVKETGECLHMKRDLLLRVSKASGGEKQLISRTTAEVKPPDSIHLCSALP